MSSYETGKLTYTSQEWDTLTRREQQLVMTAQKQGSSRSQRKMMRARLQTEAAQETLDAMPEYAELKSRYDTAMATISDRSFDMETRLMDVGIHVRFDQSGPRDVPAHVCRECQQSRISSEDIVIEDTFKTCVHEWDRDQPIPTDEELDQEHEKLIAFATAVTKHRKDFARAAAGYDDLIHEYRKQTIAFVACVKTLFESKLALES